jgi:transposase
MDDQKNTRIQFLREHGSLNPRAKDVVDEMFTASEFFDACDLVQVKYEMLRRVRVEGHSVTQAASAFGFSRVAFYQIRAAYEEGGLPALIPKHRGPKHAHKLTDTVLSFIDKCRAADKTLRPRTLATMVRARFGLSVHPRSIERALVRRQKRGP